MARGSDENLFRQIIELNRNNKTEEFNQKFSNFTEIQIEKLYEKLLSCRSKDVVSLTKAIFSSFSYQNFQKRKSFFELLLNLMRKGRFEKEACSQIVAVVIAEIDALSSFDLLQIIYYYFKCFSRDGPFSENGWIEMFVKLLQNLVQFENVRLNGDVVKGSEARIILIDEFCSEKWHSDALLSISAAVKDVNLTVNETKKIVTKLFAEIDQLKLIDIPSLIYQILSLVNLGEKNFALIGILKIFASLEEKFVNLDPDSEEIKQRKVLKEIEGNVMLHLMHAMRQNQDVGKCLINIFKKCGSIFSSPFNTSLLLSMSQISRFNEQALEIIKSNLIICLKDDDKRKSSAWIRQKLIAETHVERILKQLVEDCAYDWDYVLEGLRELGFCLLETHLPKVITANGKIISTSNTIAHTACRWGELIILECFKKHHSVRKTLIRQVLDAIFLQSHSALYFIELLAQFVVTSPQSVLECKDKVVEHFGHLILLQYDVAVPFVKVFMPLIKLKPDLRDNLVECLKACMFSKDLDARKTAVGGFLLFLRHFQIMNVLSANSQSQSQTFPTFSSQALTGTQNDRQKVHFEKLCLEVICSLRKALSQQGEVRKLLYTGLYNVARRNVSVLQPVVDLCFQQLNGYLETVEGKLPPIHLEKSVLSTKDDLVMIEPLGTIIQTLTSCLLLLKMKSCDAENFDAAIMKKVKVAISSLVKNVAKAELEDFALDKSADYSHDTAEGKKNALMVFQLLAVYEVCLEFCLVNVKFNNDCVEVILALHTRHSAVLEILREKCVTNPNKKVALRVKDGSNVKANALVAVKKMDSSSIGFESLVGFLKQLLFDAESNHQEALNTLRDKVDFLKLIFSLTLSKLTSFVANPKSETSNTFQHLITLATSMFRFFTRDDSVAPDAKKTRLKLFFGDCLEMFASVLEVICVHYADFAERFFELMDVSIVDADDSFYERVNKFIRQFFSTLINRFAGGHDEDVEGDDKKETKQILCLIRIVERLIKFLPCTEEYYESVYSSVLLICEEQVVDEPNVAKILWSLLFHLQLQSEIYPKNLIYIAQNIYKQLGHYDNDDEICVPNVNYSSITEKTVHCVLQSLLYRLDTLVDNSSFVINKLKQNSNITKEENGCEMDTNSRRTLESDCCDMFGLIVSVWLDLLKSKIPLIRVDYVIRSLQKLYSVKTNFVRYNLILYQKKIDKHCEKLEKLSKKSLTQLTPNVYKFMSYTLDEAATAKKRTTQTVAAKSKCIREMKTVSSLIFSIENFEQSLIQLGTKCKVNFMQGAKPSTNRDFRIDIAALKKALIESAEGNTQDTTTNTNNERTPENTVGPAKRKTTNSKEKRTAKKQKI